MQSTAEPHRHHQRWTHVFRKLAQGGLVADPHSQLEADCPSRQVPRGRPAPHLGRSTHSASPSGALSTTIFHPDKRPDLTIRTETRLTESLLRYLRHRQISGRQRQSETTGQGDGRSVPTTGACLSSDKSDASFRASPDCPHPQLTAGN